jgi:diguanylate cyclase (GGDEF)-like protein/PAS domain S-box-containing protein
MSESQNNEGNVPAPDGPRLNTALFSGEGSAAEQLALLHLVVDSVPDAIIVHDTGGRIAFFNDGACALLGMTREELEHLGPFGWVTPDFMPDGAGRLERILHDGQTGFESSARRKDGGDTPTDVLSRRLDTPDGPLVVSVIRDVSERVRAKRHLEFLAYHDSLTGLSNRTAFEERLHVAIADTRRHGDILGLAYLDLDRFKPVNDEYGHEAGDAVLVTLAGRLVTAVREEDMVARMGGDEFVVLLPRMASSAEFEPLAERLLDTVHWPICAGEAAVEVSATIGFALFDNELDDARSLVVKADVAMYMAKREPSRPWLQWSAEMGMSAGATPSKAPLRNQAKEGQ